MKWHTFGISRMLMIRLEIKTYHLCDVSSYIVSSLKLQLEGLLRHRFLWLSLGCVNHMLSWIRISVILQNFLCFGNYEHILIYLHSAPIMLNLFIQLIPPLPAIRFGLFVLLGKVLEELLLFCTWNILWGSGESKGSHCSLIVLCNLIFLLLKF